jgi:hypothetical protein
MHCARPTLFRFVTSLLHNILTSSFQEIIMNKPKHSRSRVATNKSSLCQFPFADGRTCRMLRHRQHPSLCIFHARAERQLLESTRLGSEIGASITGGFMTSTDINFVLGKLYIALAQNRISRRTANTLAYIGQLMLEYSFQTWQEMENKAIPLSKLSPELPPGDPEKP